LTLTKQIQSLQSPPESVDGGKLEEEKSE